MIRERDLIHELFVLLRHANRLLLELPDLHRPEDFTEDRQIRIHRALQLAAQYGFEGDVTLDYGNGIPITEKEAAALFSKISSNPSHIAKCLQTAGYKPRYSTGIHGRITSGFGELDFNGFFQYPLPDREEVES